MSTSVMVSYRDPNSRQSPFTFTRAACFGTMNRLDSHNRTREMDVMEWHPQHAGRPDVTTRNNTCTPRKAFNFINSFGMWKDVFHMTPINTVAAFMKETPIDGIITGFMSMRDFQQRSNTFIYSGGELSDKIEFALFVSGIYRNRYGTGLSINQVSHGENGVCRLNPTDDALSLYLLVYGTKEQFEGCWAQNCIGEGETSENNMGYVRDSSGDGRTRPIRARRPQWGSLSCWMRTWLLSRPEHLQDKLGRLDVRRFYDGLNARLVREESPTPVRQAEIISAAFEELREMFE